MGIPKPDCLKPGCLQFYAEALFCTLARSRGNGVREKWRPQSMSVSASLLERILLVFAPPRGFSGVDTEFPYRVRIVDRGVIAATLFADTDLRPFALSFADLFLFLFGVVLRPTAFRTTAFGNCRYSQRLSCHEAGSPPEIAPTNFAHKFSN